MDSGTVGVTDGRGGPQGPGRVSSTRRVAVRSGPGVTRPERRPSRRGSYGRHGTSVTPVRPVGPPGTRGRPSSVHSR